MRTVEAQVGHAEALLYRMPTEQRERLLNMHGPRAASAIRDNIRKSPVTWCGVDDEGVVNLGGVLPQESGVGYVWQFITPAIRDHKRDYLRQGRAVQAAMLAIFGRLVTVIEAEYVAALRYLRMNGWSIGHEQIIGGIPACVCVRDR